MGLLMAMACSAMLPLQSQASEEMDALLDVLVKRNVITQDDVASIKQEVAAKVAAKQSSGAAAEPQTVEVIKDSRIDINDSVESLKFYGDLRLRYQFENAAKQNIDDTTNRSRWRYRLRAGIDYEFDSNWSAGLRVETASANDSTNANWGGFFDKQNDDLYLGLAYAQYSSEDMEITLGKHKQPFNISGAFWDSDINPEGISEEFAFEDFSLRFGQYIIDEEDNRKNLAEDDFLLVAQMDYSIGDFNIAPIFLTTTSGDSFYSENGGGLAGENSITYFDNFQVIALPFSYSFKTGGVSSKLYGTWGVNLQGDDAINNPDSPYYTGVERSSRNQFFNVGYQYGKAKKAGSWQAAVEYRFLEAASYTPNLSDSDFGKNELNMQGVVAAAKYAITNNIMAGATMILADDIDDTLKSDVSDLGKANILQLDLMVKF